MSLGSDNVDPSEPNHAGSSYRPSLSTNEPPPTASQVTVVHHPHSEPNHREHQLPMDDPRINAIPYAPSPPEAPTVPSVPSDEEVYGQERYAGYRAEYPHYAPSTPGMSQSVRFDPTPFVVGGMQTDPLVQRDFKDDLVRAAGAVTPGVSDVPYIRYALEAITGQGSEAPPRAPLVNNRPATNNPPYIPQPQRAPQHSVHVSQPAPTRQSLVAIPTREDPVPRGRQTPFHAPISPSTEEEQTPVQEPQPAAQPVWPPVRQLLSQPVNQQVKQPERTRLDEIADNFYRAKTLVEGRGTPPPNNNSPPRTVDVWRAQPDPSPKRDVEARGYGRASPPPLTHKPWILRTSSLLLLALLCVLILAALIFSAVYSISHNGFINYAGTIYGGQYFLFRVLPQLLGAVLLIYAQCVIAAVFRIFPLSAMASDDRTERRNAVFLPLYPKSFLWPQLFGPWQVWVPTVVVWLMNFTIPLLSSLYTVVLVDGVWRWSTVQGVAWTLVALYVSLLVATVVLFIYWRHRKTGMIQTWDVRSIADIIFTLAPSNSLPQYRGLETAATRGTMRKTLEGTAERLGYWTTPEVPENRIFWGIGVPTTEEDIELEKADNKNWAAARDSSRPAVLLDVEDQRQPWAARFRYLPWCFRDSPMIFLVVAEAALLITLLIVSFLPSTNLRSGFLPHLSAAPLAGAFSPADFLYSFLPSLIGLVLFLGFQSLELTLRILAPWGELAREEGSRAETSLLLDYAASYPWQSTLTAIRLKHWRVAFITFVTPLFVLIPILSGGLFMALTPPSSVVRVFPNAAIFALLLALLFLYLIASISLIPNRKQFRLPHAVTCLAEIISFCSNEQLRTDEAFDQALTSDRHDLLGALDCGKDWHRQGRWIFGAGKNEEERLGIKRFSKFTVNPTKLRQYDRHAWGKSISAPLFRDSGELYGHF
ncbi:hypothetical protein F5Y08DRAFT_323868 [Xylaria arbuscula]|nr:hypothetical protein F5Y08DRAFT_323868 [Xylaria arbuscula]